MKYSISAATAAKELGVAERTVRRWIADGRLPALRHGRAFEVDLEEARAVQLRSRHGKARARTDELAEMRGRYLELKARVDYLESELAAERRRNGQLQARADAA